MRKLIFNGRRFLYFAGTGYLGLQSHPEVIAAAQAAVAQYGVHSATSRTGMGSTPLLEEVERRAAEFLGTEAALYLMSGYVGNFAITSVIGPSVDLAFIDESAHFCSARVPALVRPTQTFLRSSFAIEIHSMLPNCSKNIADPVGSRYS